MEVKKYAFTLAEIMIVLSVIGILTAILLPVAMNSTPDENVMKFKKGHNTLGTVIRELVMSDKYYLDGDLSTRIDGTQLLGSFSNLGGSTTTDETILKYFCSTFADIVNTKAVNCSTVKTAENDSTGITFIQIPPSGPIRPYQATMEDAKKKLDSVCETIASKIGAEIVTSDDIIFYQTNPAATFGVAWNNLNYRLFRTVDTNYNKLNMTYKPFCMDIDGIGKGEAPFGYGIRIDGKIVPGARADEWLLKDIQGGED